MNFDRRSWFKSIAGAAASVPVVNATESTAPVEQSVQPRALPVSDQLACDALVVLAANRFANLLPFWHFEKLDDSTVLRNTAGDYSWHGRKMTHIVVTTTVPDIGLAVSVSDLLDSFFIPGSNGITAYLRDNAVRAWARLPLPSPGMGAVYAHGRTGGGLEFRAKMEFCYSVLAWKFTFDMMVI